MIFVWDQNTKVIIVLELIIEFLIFINMTWLIGV
jgi:hypothetical protein